jgi:hypothetical protein
MNRQITVKQASVIFLLLGFFLGAGIGTAITELIHKDEGKKVVFGDNPTKSTTKNKPYNRTSYESNNETQ